MSIILAASLILLGAVSFANTPREIALKQIEKERSANISSTEAALERNRVDYTKKLDTLDKRYYNAHHTNIINIENKIDSDIYNRGVSAYTFTQNLARYREAKEKRTVAIDNKYSREWDKLDYEYDKEIARLVQNFNSTNNLLDAREQSILNAPETPSVQHKQAALTPKVVLSDEERVQKDPWNIRYINAPSDKIKNMAVETNPLTIGAISEASPELIKKAIRANKMAFFAIKKPSDDIIAFAKECGVVVQNKQEASREALTKMLQNRKTPATDPSL